MQFLTTDRLSPQNTRNYIYTGLSGMVILKAVATSFLCIKPGSLEGRGISITWAEDFPPIAQTCSGGRYPCLRQGVGTPVFNPNYSAILCFKTATQVCEVYFLTPFYSSGQQHLKFIYRSQDPQQHQESLALCYFHSTRDQCMTLVFTQSQYQKNSPEVCWIEKWDCCIQKTK